MLYDWRALAGLQIENFSLVELTDGDVSRATFLARAEGSEQPVSIELIAPGAPGEKEQTERWTALRHLQHPNLQRVLAAGRAFLNGTDFAYCAKEQPDARLSGVIVERRLTAEEARDLFAAALRCLEFLHTRSFSHGSVNASSLLAVGNETKLAATTVSRCGPEDCKAAFARDLQGAGELVLAATASEAERTAVAALPMPLREVVRRCLDANRSGEWTARAALDMLLGTTPVAVALPAAGRVTAPALTEAPHPWLKRGLIAGIAVVLLAMGFTALRGPHRERAQTRRAQDTADRVIPREPASPPEWAVTPAEALPQPSLPEPVETKPKPKKKERVQRQTNSSGGWAVIAATYSNYEAGRRRAESLRGKLAECECRVFPPQGEGSHYYVVVASGLDREAAERLRDQARASGLPPDTYVTKLPTAQPTAQDTR